MRDDVDSDDLHLLERLQEANARADQAERMLARVQSSFPMTVGQLVIDAGQSPRRLMALPFTLLRMRRNRRSLRAARSDRRTVAIPEQPRDLGLAMNPYRILVPRRATTWDMKPSYLVIGPTLFVEELRQHVHVSVALPHNATALVRALDPDAVIVHSRAGHDGGAWFPLGEPGEATREQTLVHVRDMCHSLGRPVVLVHDPTGAPGLTPFAATCDLVVDVSDEGLLCDLIAKWQDSRNG